MSCLVLPMPGHPSAGSLRPALTQSRKGKGNVSQPLALVWPGPPGTAETPAALWISCHQSELDVTCTGGAATEQHKDNEGWGHSTGWVLLCAWGSRAELFRQDDQPRAQPQDTHDRQGPLGATGCRAAAQWGTTADS